MLQLLVPAATERSGWRIDVHVTRIVWARPL
jgi:hypothetical protein